MEKKLDAILLANFNAYGPQGGNYNLYYASNILRRYHQCFFLLTEDKAELWVDASDHERAKTQSWLEPQAMAPIFDLTGNEYAREIARCIRKMLDKEAPQIGVDGRYLSSSIAMYLMKDGINLTDVSMELEWSRIVKDHREIELHRKAAEIADKGACALMETVREGVTEVELAAAAEHEMRRHGAESFWWKTLVGSGPAQSYNMFGDSPNERRIEKGDIVTFDLTPVYEGYSADLARTFVYGEPSKEQLEMLTLTEKSQKAAIASLVAGVKISKVVKAAERIVKGSRFEEFYVGPGHGLGLNEDQYPILTPPWSSLNLKHELLENMVIAVEVAIKAPYLGGVCFEDNFRIGSSRPERLTHAEIVYNVG